MKRWTRWQDWVAIAAGLYAALSTSWTATQTGMTISLMIVLGVLMIAAGVWSLAGPKMVSMEWILAGVSALMFLSPWFGSFASDMGPAWTAWICGAVGIIAGLWALAPARRAHGATPGGHMASHA